MIKCLRFNHYDEYNKVLDMMKKCNMKLNNFFYKIYEIKIVLYVYMYIGNIKKSIT